MHLEELQRKERGEMPSNKNPIYIVDDDESVCRALKFLLVSYGFEVKTFSSAEDFFSAVPNSAQGCLILDFHMPGLKGWEVQRRLLKSGSTHSVIIITADRNEGLRDLTSKAGAVGFLQKPFRDQELVDLVHMTHNQQPERKLML
jgi:FixJ family two-component response regulator